MININDLENAKKDVDHIADIATSQELTATDRKGNTKKTIAGVLGDLGDILDTVAAEAAGNIFADTNEGLVRTIEGGFFSTPAADDDTFLILYRHDPGGVATEIKRYPSAAAVSDVGRAATLLPGGTVNVSFETQTISATAIGQSIVSYASSFSTIPPGQSNAFSAPNPVALTWIVYDTSARVLGVKQYPDVPEDNDVVIGIVNNRKFVSNAPGNNLLVFDENGAPIPAENLVSATAYNARGMAKIVGPGSLAVNFQSGKITFSGTSTLAASSHRYVAIANPQEVTFDASSPIVLRYLCVDGAGALSIVRAPATPSPEAIVIDVIYQQQSVWKPGGYSLVNAAGESVPTTPETPNIAFNQADHRAVLPSEIYFIPGNLLRMYRRPVFSTYDDRLLGVKFWLNRGTSIPLKDRYSPIGRQTDLDPTKLAATFEVSYQHQDAPNVRYIRAIKRTVADPAALSGRSLKWLPIGDSLTEGGMATAVITQLGLLGASADSVGTYKSSLTNNLLGEGRGNWSLRSFVGKSNRTGGFEIVVAPAGIETTKYQNPFLRLANNTDKSDHPTWCFRSTGAIVEHDYSTDPNPESGDFWIFDFAQYLSRGIDEPDMITIALSTNDINLDRTQYSREARLAAARLGLEIMVRQIKSALPDVIIGIVPAPAWSNTANTIERYGEVSDWIEHCITDVEALAAELGDITVVPVWPFMHPDLVYPYASSSPLSARNKTTVNTITDWVHFNAQGRAQYAEIVAAWAACVLPPAQ